MSMRNVLLFVCVAAAGCRGGSQPSETKRGEARTAAPRARKGAESGRPEPRPKQEQHHEDHDETHVRAAPGKPVPLPADGRLGEPLSKAPAVPVAELPAKARELKGKEVKVSGKVVAWCHHRRAWFALGTEPRKPVVMVRTAPKFTVPDGVAGLMATAEGVLSVERMGEARAKHMAKMHGFFGGDPAKISGPQEFLVLQARGVVFQVGGGSAQAGSEGRPAARAAGKEPARQAGRPSR